MWVCIMSHYSHSSNDDLLLVIYSGFGTSPNLIIYFIFATNQKSIKGRVAGRPLLWRVGGQKKWSGMTCSQPRYLSSSVQRICRWGFHSRGFAFCWAVVLLVSAWGRPAARHTRAWVITLWQFHEQVSHNELTLWSQYPHCVLKKSRAVSYSLQSLCRASLNLVCWL